MSNRKKPEMQDKLMRSFGRVNGRKLGSQQQRLVDELLPALSVKLSSKINNINDIFKVNYKDYIVEIGFGKGEHLAEFALKNPDIVSILSHQITDVSHLMKFAKVCFQMRLLLRPL